MVLIRLVCFRVLIEEDFLMDCRTSSISATISASCNVCTSQNVVSLIKFSEKAPSSSSLALSTVLYCFRWYELL